MKTTPWKIAATVFGLAAAGSHAAEPAPPPPQAPAEIVAMLKEHRGQWRTEGQIISMGEAKSAGATWECKAAVDGIGNVCTWEHEYPDGKNDAALEIMGYDPVLKTMSITRVTDQGLIGTVQVTVSGNTMTVRRESKADGKSVVGLNEIIVKAPGEWVQHATTDVDGKRVYEMNNKHHRVK
jgi:hypothetical protein